MERTEKDVEKYLCKKIKELGGKAYKFVSPGNAGVPDRICIIPAGDKAKVVFVEAKRPGGVLRMRQCQKLKELRGIKAECAVVDSYERVNELIAQLRLKDGD